MFTCEICSTEIVEDIRQDEGGSYHGECYDEWLRQEQEEWAKRFRSRDNVTEAEWFDAYGLTYKNPAHVDRMIDLADNAR